MANITAALTGGVTSVVYNIPETPQQIAECAYECRKEDNVVYGYDVSGKKIRAPTR